MNYFRDRFFKRLAVEEQKPLLRREEKDPEEYLSKMQQEELERKHRDYSLSAEFNYFVSEWIPNHFHDEDKHFDELFYKFVPEEYSNLPEESVEREKDLFVKNMFVMFLTGLSSKDPSAMESKRMISFLKDFTKRTGIPVDSTNARENYLDMMSEIFTVGRGHLSPIREMYNKNKKEISVDFNQKNSIEDKDINTEQTGETTIDANGDIISEGDFVSMYVDYDSRHENIRNVPSGIIFDYVVDYMAENKQIPKSSLSPDDVSKVYRAIEANPVYKLLLVTFDVKYPVKIVKIKKKREDKRFLTEEGENEERADVTVDSGGKKLVVRNYDLTKKGNTDEEIHKIAVYIADYLFRTGDTLDSLLQNTNEGEKKEIVLPTGDVSEVTKQLTPDKGEIYTVKTEGEEQSYTKDSTKLKELIPEGTTPLVSV